MSNSNITVIETKWEDVIEGIDLLKRKNLSLKMWDDAIIVSRMRRVKTNKIYSYDRDLDNLGVKREF
nr:PIN domain-containing protein [Candidatus Acidianus copahuensis]